MLHCIQSEKIRQINVVGTEALIAVLVYEISINKSPKGTNVCAMIGVKWYGGCVGGVSLAV